MVINATYAYIKNTLPTGLFKNQKPPERVANCVAFVSGFRSRLDFASTAVCFRLCNSGCHLCCCADGPGAAAHVANPQLAATAAAPFDALGSAITACLVRPVPANLVTLRTLNQLPLLCQGRRWPGPPCRLAAQRLPAAGLPVLRGRRLAPFRLRRRGTAARCGR